MGKRSSQLKNLFFFDFIPREVLLHGTDSSRKRNLILPRNPNHFQLPIFRNLFPKTTMKKIKTKILPEVEFKEFEPRLKFKPGLKYGWFYLK